MRKKLFEDCKLHGKTIYVLYTTQTKTRNITTNENDNDIHNNRNQSVTMKETIIVSVMIMI